MQLVLAGPGAFSDKIQKNKQHLPATDAQHLRAAVSGRFWSGINGTGERNYSSAASSCRDSRPYIGVYFLKIFSEIEGGQVRKKVLELAICMKIFKGISIQPYVDILTSELLFWYFPAIPRGQ